MPVPLIGLDGGLRYFVAAVRGCFSKPQYQCFVSVRLAQRQPLLVGGAVVGSNYVAAARASMLR